MTMGTRAEAATALLVWALCYLLFELAGGRFVIAYDLWQFLPWPALYHDLGGALLDLHAQPPLLNLVLGLALKLSVTIGAKPEAWLQAAQAAIGAVTVLATWALAVELIPRTALRRTLLLLYVANPYFHASLHFFFYTVWDPFLLALIAWGAHRFFAQPGAGRAAACLLPAVLLVHTRSLYHPLWLVALALALAARARSAPAARPVALVAAAALATVAVWPAKNLLRFGVAGYSSWQGYNFSRGLVAELPLAMHAFVRRHADPPALAAAAAARQLVPERFRARPVLAALAKPDGSPNWNHAALIVSSRELGRETRARIAHAPWLLGLRAVDYYLNGYTVYEGRDVYSLGYVKELEPAPRWARAWEILTTLSFRRYDPEATRLTTGFAVLFPLLIAALVVKLWRRRRAWSTADRSAALLLFSTLWILAMVLLVDGAEGNRMRFDSHAFLLLLAGWLAGGAPADGRLSE